MSELSFREARREDLPAIIAMLADDGLGGQRESPQADGVDPVYEAAFDEVAAQTNNRIIVAEKDGQIVGTMHLAIIAGLSRRGARRAQIEAVRTARPMRGQGIGDALLHYAIDEARAAGCKLVQLTSDKRRGRAHIFYERVGFVATHVGFKMELK